MSFPTFHDVTIKSERVGLGTETTIDGQRLKGIRDLTVHFGIDEMNSILVEMIAEAISIKTDGEVAYVAAIKHPVTGEAYTGQAATPVEAFEIALQAMRDAGS